jgi:hypothetical protein
MWITLHHNFNKHFKKYMFEHNTLKLRAMSFTQSVKLNHLYLFSSSTQPAQLSHMRLKNVHMQRYANFTMTNLEYEQNGV